MSTNGVADPDRQEDKPVGLVYVGLAGPDGARAAELHLAGDREAIRTAAVRAAVSVVLDAVRAVGATG